MIALMLLSTAMAYARGVRRVWQRAGVGRGVSRRQTILFGIGLAVVALALSTPVDAMADDLFAAHMAQHMLLAAIAPPFLVFGAPLTAAAWALPDCSRRRVTTALRRCAPLRSVWLVMTAPAMGWLIHFAAMWGWHTPTLYQLALRSEWVHALEHLSFIGTAILVWWPIAHPRVARRTAYAAGIITLFLTAMQTGVLGALITLSHHVWYPAQTSGTARWAVTPLDDQTLAGLIMWVPGGLIYVAAMSVLFLKWLEPATARHRSLSLPTSTVARVAAMSMMLIAAASCTHADADIAVPGGDADRGKEAVEAQGCGACHTISGVATAHGEVGPPLTGIARRSILAGELANTPENMVRWIEDPQAVEPGTAMPNLGINVQTARDIAAYMYTLR
jgi:cytochrome c oxidase assembly factor CtaG